MMNNVLNFELPEENPWVKPEITVTDVYKEGLGYAKGLTLLYKNIKWENKFYVPGCMKYEIKRLDTNKIVKVNHPTFSVPRSNKDEEHYPQQQSDYKDYVALYWPKKSWRDPDIYVAADLIEIRIEDKLLQHTKKVIDLVQLGDFVKCTGTRSGDWNKVEGFSKSGIFGPKYSKPKEGFLRYAASENHITKVREIIRDGVKIL